MAPPPRRMVGDAGSGGTDLSPGGLGAAQSDRGICDCNPFTRLALQTGAVAPTLLLSHPVCFGPTTIACSGSERVDRVEESQAMNILARWLPGLAVLRRYDPAWLRQDLTAGLVLTTMLVPVGIAYAVASGVPGINGLYATIVPLLAYALFGPSRILVLGPDCSLAAVILAVVAPLSDGDPIRAVAVASMMAVVSGLVCILIGILRLGFVTEL